MKKCIFYVTLAVFFASLMMLIGSHQPTHAQAMASPYPTFSCSASAGWWSSSSSASPGIGNVDFGSPGNGWTGNGRASAGAGGGNPSTDSGSISAYIAQGYYEFSFHSNSGSTSSTVGTTYNYVNSSGRSESKWRPGASKWASASGSFAGIYDDAYDDY